MREVRTLEDLREYLASKYDTEWEHISVEEKLEKQAEILCRFELSSEEYNYAAPLTLALEDQSAKKTIINTSKAKEILVKRK
ncbi:hypothetical protein [Pseudoalteromonas rubra]|uniref:Uncharacterized protein n=1 Tax=Pseudoalteromonas rubra TaxID=43658 RepID=A0A0F4QJA6_9GAMM|nr:hypothetical protein [Pseudoalteromonas rubra]KJZ06742.1 hypothetical protein TW77_18230 [Pseudoalteromonas rubra]